MQEDDLCHTGGSCAKEKYWELAVLGVSSLAPEENAATVLNTV